MRVRAQDRARAYHEQHGAERETLSKDLRSLRPPSWLCEKRPGTKQKLLAETLSQQRDNH